MTRFERQHLATDDNDLIAGLRVATFARSLRVHDEITKAGDLDLLALLQTDFNDIKCRLDDIGRVFFGEADFLIDSTDDICLGHG